MKTSSSQCYVHVLAPTPNRLRYFHRKRIPFKHYYSSISFLPNSGDLCSPSPHYSCLWRTTIARFHTWFHSTSLKSIHRHLVPFLPDLIVSSFPLSPIWLPPHLAITIFSCMQNVFVLNSIIFNISFLLFDKRPAVCRGECFSYTEEACVLSGVHRCMHHLVKSMIDTVTAPI